MALLNKAKVTFSVILSVKIYAKHKKKSIVACWEQLGVHMQHMLQEHVLPVKM